MGPSQKSLKSVRETLKFQTEQKKKGVTLVFGRREFKLLQSIGPWFMYHGRGWTPSADIVLAETTLPRVVAAIHPISQWDSIQMQGCHAHIAITLPVLLW